MPDPILPWTAPEEAAGPSATLTAPPDGDTHPAPNGPAAVVDTLIAGRYRLAEPLGEGGMGAVYRAEQTEPVRRTVAVKLIKAGLDSAAIVARFDAERQALAVMDHPHIARVFDGGVTADGRPFFVMEFVPGKPVTDFCDERRLTARQRLELFVPVCEAIQHAHQKGVIHRDIKPSNVLVSEVDGRPVPKVIDFGVAKATGDGLTGETLHTAAGAVVGTPVYMSPEQAAGGPDVDTRTDVYALGVLLYELLTGTTPFEKERFKKAALHEMVRMVLEEEPPRPSTRLSTADGRIDLAAARGADPAKLSRLLRREVDWIVMKALEKDRGRRYDTAAGLAKDVRRYLADEVVEARPPSTGYRLRKFVRRYRGPVVAAGVVFAALVAGVAGTAVGLARAVRAERSAVAAATVAEEQKKRAEEGERTAVVAQADAEAVVMAFQNMFMPAGRPAGPGRWNRSVSLGTTVDFTTAKVAETFRGRPLVEASIRLTLCGAYFLVGDYGRAITQAERSYALRAAALGPDHPNTLYSLSMLAFMCQIAGDSGRAIALSEDCLRRTTAASGPDSPNTLRNMDFLATAYFAAGDFARATLLYDDCLKRKQALLGPDHPDTLQTQDNLAYSYVEQGNPKSVAAVFDDLHKRRRATLGPDHVVTQTVLQNYASAVLEGGDHRRAEMLFREVLAVRGVRQPDAYWTFKTRAMLGAALLGQKRFTEAESLLLAGYEGMKRQKDRIALTQTWHAEAADRLVHLYEQTGRPAEAAKWRAERLTYPLEIAPPPRPAKP